MLSTTSTKQNDISSLAKTTEPPMLAKLLFYYTVNGKINLTDFNIFTFLLRGKQMHFNANYKKIIEFVLHNRHLFLPSPQYCCSDLKHFMQYNFCCL